MRYAVQSAIHSTYLVDVCWMTSLVFIKPGDRYYFHFIFYKKIIEINKQMEVMSYNNRMVRGRLDEGHKLRLRKENVQLMTR